MRFANHSADVTTRDLKFTSPASLLISSLI